MQMKKRYPVVLTPDKSGFTVYIPDFDIYTQGETLDSALQMAGDAIGLMGIDMEDDNLPIPEPRKLCDVKTENDQRAVVVDVDFAEYRRKNDKWQEQSKAEYRRKKDRRAGATEG